MIGVGLFYRQKVAKQEPVKSYKTTEVEKPTQPQAPIGETSQGGHFHEDGTSHAGPHEAHAPAEISKSTQPPASQRTTGGGYWSNGVYHRPAGYMPAHPRGQTSSNPFFADGVPEHLKCPEKWIGDYIWANGEWEAAREKIRQVSREVREKYNPNRPIHEVWARYIEDELFYQANADIPPLDPGRYPPGSFAEAGAAPKLAEAVDRIDWWFQHILDYPEISELRWNDSTTYNNAWRMELGFDKPGWNVVELVDGRNFRARSHHRYKFTFTDGDQTFTSGYSHSGGPDAPLVEININETSDEELEALGIDYSIIPYRQGGK